MASYRSREIPEMCLPVIECKGTCCVMGAFRIRCNCCAEAADSLKSIYIHDPHRQLKRTEALLSSFLGVVNPYLTLSAML